MLDHNTKLEIVRWRSQGSFPDFLPHRSTSLGKQNELYNFKIAVNQMNIEQMDSWLYNLEMALTI